MPAAPVAASTAATTAEAVIVSGQAAAEIAIREELAEALPGVTPRHLTTPGDDGGEGLWHVAADPRGAWSSAPPMFIRHVMPVDLAVPLVGGEADLAMLVTAATTLVPRVDPSRTISVQTRIVGDVGYRPFPVNAAIAALLPAPIDVRRPDQIVSVLVVAAHDGAHDSAPAVGYLGLSTPAENLSDWAGGMRRLKRDDAQVSRAESKLVEAIEVFALDLPAAGGVAVDLGAAPGGWTRVLRAHGLRVLAIDPAALDARVVSDRGVTWLPTTAERWLATGPTAVDVLVVDMKMDARDVARLIAPLARLVTRWAVVTLKLPSYDQRAVARAALDLLARDWAIVGARQLFHNRSEITVALRPPALRGESPA